MPSGPGSGDEPGATRTSLRSYDVAKGLFEMHTTSAAVRRAYAQPEQ